MEVGQQNIQPHLWDRKI